MLTFMFIKMRPFKGFYYMVDNFEPANGGKCVIYASVTLSNSHITSPYVSFISRSY